PPRPTRRGGPVEAPRLAEVTFPAATTIEDAKSFIFRELQELPIQSGGHSLRWVEQPDCVVLELSGPAGAGHIPGGLEAGITEWSVPEPGTAWARESARGPGWAPDGGECWVTEPLGLRALGRTTRLTTTPCSAWALACFPCDILFAPACEPASSAEGAPL